MLGPLMNFSTMRGSMMGDVKETAEAMGTAMGAGAGAAAAAGRAVGKTIGAAEKVGSLPGRLGATARTDLAEAAAKGAGGGAIGEAIGVGKGAGSRFGSVGAFGGPITGVPGLSTPLPGLTPPLPGLTPTFPVRPGVVLPTFPFLPTFTVKTATQLAESAIQMLDGAQPDPLNAALATIKAKRVSGDKLIEYLERRVRVGEVLQRLATHWSPETKEDFGAAFQLGTDRLDVMDLIVAISILSDPDLDDEIRAENIQESTDQDLLENRQIVWQHPPPGSVLEPPYMILVAVEHRDVAEAERTVEGILRRLTTVDGYRLTHAAAGRLNGASRRPVG